jgi:hypothetical protein
MDLISTFQGIAASGILLGTLLVLTGAIFVPKQQRGKVLRRVGRWLQGF